MLARRCGRIVAMPVIIALILIYFSYWPLSIPFIVIAVFCAFFFRDPRRSVGKGIVAAADGVIRDVSITDNQIVISTFMNLHNVHVNRSPTRGKVAGVRRVKGGHSPAYGENADNNSRIIIFLDTRIGRVTVTQIAGTFAWRIVPYVRRGQALKKGWRIGMIRFGSRVDVALPVDRVRAVVIAGDKVKAGSSTIAEVLR
jgi:phosphatidylserine decarboxylase